MSPYLNKPHRTEHEVYTARERQLLQAYIHDACRAEELNNVDDLEAYANKMRAEKEETQHGR